MKKILLALKQWKIDEFFGESKFSVFGDIEQKVKKAFLKVAF